MIDDMNYKRVLEILNESPYTKAFTYFRIWCDEHTDEYVKQKSSLFKYGKENKIPLKILKEISEDMEIPISNTEWEEYN